MQRIARFLPRGDAAARIVVIAALQSEWIVGARAPAAVSCFASCTAIVSEEFNSVGRGSRGMTVGASSDVQDYSRALLPLMLVT